MSNTHPKSDGVWVGRYEIVWSNTHQKFQAVTADGRVHFEHHIGKEVFDWAFDKEVNLGHQTNNGSGTKTIGEESNSG